jgi:hypothetical protein
MFGAPRERSDVPSVDPAQTIRTSRVYSPPSTETEIVVTVEDSMVTGPATDRQAKKSRERRLKTQPLQEQLRAPPKKQSEPTTPHDKAPAPQSARTNLLDPAAALEAEIIDLRSRLALKLTEQNGHLRMMLDRYKDE